MNKYGKTFDAKNVFYSYELVSICYRHGVSWVADRTYKYCPKMKNIIPSQTENRMYEKMAGQQTHMDHHLFKVLLYHQNMYDLSYVLSHVQRTHIEH